MEEEEEEEEEDEKVAEDEDGRQGMRARALPVDGDPDFDSGPPVDGFEYLRAGAARGQKRAGGDGISKRSIRGRSITNKRVATCRSSAVTCHRNVRTAPGRIRIGNGEFLADSPTFACGCRGRRRGERCLADRREVGRGWPLHLKRHWSEWMT